jgi:hypothetical protein
MAVRRTARLSSVLVALSLVLSSSNFIDGENISQRTITWENETDTQIVIAVALDGGSFADTLAGGETGFVIKRSH